MGFIYHESTDYCLLVGTTRGRMVVWKKPASGDKFAPYKDPVGNLPLVRFCSEFGYYAAASGFPVDVPISHLAIAADPGSNPDGHGIVTVYTSVAEVDYVLATHGLGYPPNFAVSVDGVEYPAGCPIQTGPSGARRCVSFWVDATKIYVKESARPSIPGLPALTITYRVTVFRDPGPVPGAALYQSDMSASPAFVQFGHGNVDTREASLREAEPGETVYAIPSEPTLSLANGRPKWALPDGTQFIVGPTSGVTAYDAGFYGGPSKKVTI